MIKPKFTYEQVKSVFSDRGYELVSTEYYGVKKKLKYICLKHRDKGVQQITFCSLYSQNHGCRYCAMDKLHKYSYNEVKKEFSERGYELVSTQYHNVMSNLDYICNKHRDKGVQQITFSKLHNNHGCYWCGRERTEAAHRIEFNKKSDEHLCNSHDFEYIDTVRENGKISIVFICNKHREFGEQKMTKKNMERNIKGCKYCVGRDLPEWYVLKKANVINPHIKLLEPYKNLTTRMNCYCEIHNCKTRKSMQDILKGKGCYRCGIEKQSQLSFLSLEEFQKRVRDKDNTVEVLEYHGMEQKAKYRCEKCGHIWESSARTMVASGKQCPNCKKYYVGERQIATILDEWDIKYEQQYRFDKCVDKRALPFDFYLTDYNVCIEFDGIHHFEQRKGWTSLEEVLHHDKIKDKFCKNNNIPLIRIPYWESGEMEYYLFDKLVENNVLENIENTD